MAIEIIETREFTKERDRLLKKRSLLKEDYDDFKKELAQNPEKGDRVEGTGGVRKVRLKSASGGKSGGFRVCYYFMVSKDDIYFIWLFPKNEQENLTKEEKGILKDIVTQIKGTK
jgi:hypothetical protein